MMLDLVSWDVDRLYWAAFEDPEGDGLLQLTEALGQVGRWKGETADKVYDLYLSHVRHVLATRRDREYLTSLSAHLLSARELLKKPALSLSRRLGVLEDMVDEYLAGMLPPAESKRRREHVVGLLKTLDAADGSMERALIRDAHKLKEANLSRILKVMEEEGLVEREQSGRQVWVRLTAYGREQLVAAGISLKRSNVFNPDEDSSVNALANYAKWRFSIRRLIKEDTYAAAYGREVGVTLVRYCGADDDGALKFSMLWTALLENIFDGHEGDDRAVRGRIRVALMSLLQSYAREFAEQSARELRRTQDFNDTVFASLFRIGHGQWNEVLTRAERLGAELNNARLPSHQVLLIGASGYHEERILGKLAVEFFLTANGFEGLQIASSPWAADGRLDGFNKPFGKYVGEADIRLVNYSADRNGAARSGWSQPVFRHRGYRAFANKRWLEEQLHERGTPSAVCNWIEACLGERDGVFTPDTLPQRAWLCLKGEPVNYAQTEFQALLEYLFDACAQLSKDAPVIVPRPVAGHIDPDDVFEEFLTGQRKVLMSGSIHDLLIEEFWTTRARTFVRLLDKDDFQELYNRTPLGYNSIRFSPRLQEAPSLKVAVKDLYDAILMVVMRIARGSDARLKRALYAYVATILAPTHRENWNTRNTDTRWSFAGSFNGIERLILNEMENYDEGIEHQLQLEAAFLVASK
jgi:DNA-binding MarR family transcriptional regulator